MVLRLCSSVFPRFREEYLHPTRLIVYSASCSGILEVYFVGCLRLFGAIFGGHLGGVWGVFYKVLEGKTITV